MSLAIAERAGRCSWCGCTERQPCRNGCSWANVGRTVCSECAVLDRMVRSREGRSVLASILRVLRAAEWFDA